MTTFIPTLCHGCWRIIGEDSDCPVSQVGECEDCRNAREADERTIHEYLEIPPPNPKLKAFMEWMRKLEHV